MTEAEWLACVEVNALLEFVRDRTSERKRALFAAACCRHVWDLIEDKRSRRAVEVMERYVDGASSDGEKVAAEMEADLADTAFAARGRDTPSSRAAYAAYCVTCFGAGWDQASPEWDFALATAGYAADAARAAGTEAIQLPLLRCVFGNPFRLVQVDSSWLSDNVKDLARVIYQERLFSLMPTLAAALEEEGCTNQDFIDHCRAPGPHVRGCWVVDLLTGRS